MSREKSHESQPLATFIVRSTVPVGFLHDIFDSLSPIFCHLARNECINQPLSHVSTPFDILVF